MPEKYNISSLFDPSGNLTLHAMESYLRNKLSDAEKKLVEKHLAESDFDCESMEGLRKSGSTEFSQEVEEIQRHILLVAKERARTGKVRISGRSYWYAAAAFVGVIGLSVLMFFMFREPVDKPQLAAVQPDTVIPERAKEMNLNQESPVFETESNQEEKTESEIVKPVESVPEKAAKITEIVPEPAPQLAMREQVELKPPVAVLPDEKETADDLMIEERIVGGIAIPEKKTNIEHNHSGKEKRTSSKYGAPAQKTFTEANTGMPVYDADTMIYTEVGTMPEFPGGDEAFLQFLNDSIQYPKLAIENKIQGRVFVNFIVEKDGSISDVRVLRGIGGGCDEEAVRVVKLMPNWISGKQRGIPVRVSYVLPIMFSLEK